MLPLLKLAGDGEQRTLTEAVERLAQESPERKRIDVARAMVQHWCTCVMRSKVEPMKGVSALACNHLEGIVARTQTRQTTGSLEPLNGLFTGHQAPSPRLHSGVHLRTVIFLIAGKLDVRVINPHAPQPA